MPKSSVRALALAAALLTAGCAALNPFAEEEVARAPAPPPQPVDWMLIAPPDSAAAMIVMDSLDTLPAHAGALPRTPGDGIAPADWTQSRILVREMVAQPSPEASARFLAQSSVIDQAPRSQWRQVRRFDTRGKCEWTLGELRSITRNESAKIDYRPGMRMDDLKFLLLASSWSRGDCVREDRLPPARTG